MPWTSHLWLSQRWLFFKPYFRQCWLWLEWKQMLRLIKTDNHTWIMDVNWPITLNVKEKLNELIMRTLHCFCLWEMQQIATLIILSLVYWNHSVGYYITQALLLLSLEISIIWWTRSILPAGFPWGLKSSEFVDFRVNQGKALRFVENEWGDLKASIPAA